MKREKIYWRKQMQQVKLNSCFSICFKKCNEIKKKTMTVMHKEH